MNRKRKQSENTQLVVNDVSCAVAGVGGRGATTPGVVGGIVIACAVLASLSFTFILKTPTSSHLFFCTGDRIQDLVFGRQVAEPLNYTPLPSIHY